MLLNFLSLRTLAIQAEIMNIENFIQKANYSIWLKNVWFTNERVKTVFFEQIKKGLSVHLILAENFIEENNEFIDLQEFLDMGGELFVLPDKIYRAIKNSSFVVVDNRQLAYHCTDSQVIADGGAKPNSTWAAYLVNAYTEWFLKLETMAENVYRV